MNQFASTTEAITDAAAAIPAGWALYEVYTKHTPRGKTRASLNYFDSQMALMDYYRRNLPDAIVVGYTVVQYGAQQ